MIDIILNMKIRNRNNKAIAIFFETRFWLSIISDTGYKAIRINKGLIKRA
jgi:hypothetical protein